jgi:hypothetical protein
MRPSLDPFVGVARGEKTAREGQEASLMTGWGVGKFFQKSANWQARRRPNFLIFLSQLDSVNLLNWLFEPVSTERFKKSAIYESRHAHGLGSAPRRTARVLDQR